MRYTLPHSKVFGVLQQHLCNRRGFLLLSLLIDQESPSTYLMIIYARERDSQLFEFNICVENVFKCAYLSCKLPDYIDYRALLYLPLSI